MGQSKGPPPPDYSKLLEQGYKLQKQYVPQLVQGDLNLRQRFDQPLIDQQMALQARNDPGLANLQYQALLRRDPQAVQAHQLFGDKVAQVLRQGYVDPTRQAAYKALGQQVTGDTLRGGTASPDVLRQIQQGFEGRASANPLLGGEAPMMAQGVYTGQRLEDLKRQRQQAANQFLGQQSESDLALTAGGRFMGTPGLVQMENQIGGVQAPRGLGYFNPNAGAQSAQFGLQNYQNQLAQNQLSGGGSNPWASALGGAATGAAAGSSFGGYGALIGAGVGAAGGYLGSQYG